MPMQNNSHVRTEWEGSPLPGDRPPRKADLTAPRSWMCSLPNGEHTVLLFRPPGLELRRGSLSTYEPAHTELLNLKSTVPIGFITPFPPLLTTLCQSAVTQGGPELLTNWSGKGMWGWLPIRTQNSLCALLFPLTCVSVLTAQTTSLNIFESQTVRVSPENCWHLTIFLEL